MKVIGLGNALVDILIPLQDDSFLVNHELPKGSMQLIDEVRSARLQRAVEGVPKIMASGGSASNTIHGLARLGVETRYIGKTGEDEIGAFFKNDLLKANIDPVLLSGARPTGTALTFISPDYERTFGTYLGSAIELEAGDLRPEYFSGYDLLHIEGYLMANQPLALRAMELAKGAGTKVSIDLASYNVVEENLDFLNHILKNYTNLVFANEDEARAFTGEEPENALKLLADRCDIAVVKIGEKGSMVSANKREYTVDAIKADVRDTTGAGDLYAAGFIYGLTKQLSPDKCANIGGVLAANVIEDFGAKISDDRWKNIKNHIETTLF